MPESLNMSDNIHYVTAKHLWLADHIPLFRIYIHVVVHKCDGFELYPNGIHSLHCWASASTRSVT
jgi:hypothetical protein